MTIYWEMLPQSAASLALFLQKSTFQDNNAQLFLQAGCPGRGPECRKCPTPRMPNMLYSNPKPYESLLTRTRTNPKPNPVRHSGHLPHMAFRCSAFRTHHDVLPVT